MKAFLSYSSEDKILGKKIYRWLRNQAVSVWFDRIELGPADSLIAKIEEGITKSDYLIVLITENSKRSHWVKKEISIALKSEKDLTGPKIIAVLVDKSRIPRRLSKNIYTTSDDEDFRGIVPALFRDSYILDITMCPENLDLDQATLIESLEEYYRSRFIEVHVRIDNRDFNRKLNKIIERVSQTKLPIDLIDLVKER
jgi:hypothetical protein